MSRVGKRDAGSISRCGESYGRAGFDSRNIKTTDKFGSVGGESRSGKVTHRGSPGDEIRRASEERGSRSDRFLFAFRSFSFFCYLPDIIGAAMFREERLLVLRLRHAQYTLFQTIIRMNYFFFGLARVLLSLLGTRFTETTFAWCITQTRQT